MNISLTPELENLVAEKVASGRYLSASEVIREALRLLEQFEQQRVVDLQQLQRQVAVGLSELDNGEFTDYDPKQMKSRISQIKKAGRKARKS